MNGRLLRAHLDPSGALVSVNGNVIPEIRLDPTPSRAATEAGATAIAAVAADNPGRDVYVRSGLLVVYRTGLAQDADGQTYLTWQMEVGNDADIREFVYVDAHSGKIVDRLPGIIDNLYRRAYDGQSLNQVPPSYPSSPYWVEGDAFPTASAEANNMITSSKETYDFYKNAFGRDSFDGAGATMDSIFNRGYQCPNASWNGTFISFCPGFTVDDVTAHEWTHAYTQYTHGLIYAWQPGALNESYSDIFGETIDLINGRGTDSPNTARTADACSVFFGTPLGRLFTLYVAVPFGGAFMALMEELKVSHDIVNVNGGACALGHPIGASGARIVGSLVHELGRRGGGLGVAAICSGGGQGDAIVLEVNGS